MQSFVERIQEHFDSLSTGQKKVAHYIQTNMQDAVMQSAHKIAENSGVSEATVHRLAQALSYTSFSNMLQDLRHYVLKDQRAVRNFLISTSHQEDSWLEKHFQQELDNLHETMARAGKSSINQAARMLLEAERIWVVGWRMGLSITSYMSFVLKYMLGNCELIPQGGVAEYATYIKPSDTVFACGFPRYCSKTLKVAAHARQEGAKIIALTDSELSPFAKLADLTLFASNKSTGFLDSYTASLSMASAIINEISYLEKNRVHKNIQKMEMMFKEFQDQFEWK
ncbi:N-acetylmannosamine kinase [Brevibacillus reuszeri]|uniref:N-acetylmannosamine kinase n=1 Tax=Brevibacillus reuszeri TaxID=54915 RepID=A0A0K9YR24_9BACL|nr:MurR/RpiR family transcriptional regulator [Brevibacillus reuszeri]KNB70635.1 transcriptional regulator [Brevibacillus reuszeri]MED1861375.1 MurR/RpiR family transcriptional regulator [Brevibacillus reuszeri]GED69916.1 N-acetylmannosamine kinase [Brevibacillus reuszeri]